MEKLGNEIFPETSFWKIEKIELSLGSKAILMASDFF